MLASTVPIGRATNAEAAMKAVDAYLPNRSLTGGGVADATIREREVRPDAALGSYGLGAYASG